MARQVVLGLWRIIKKFSGQAAYLASLRLCVRDFPVLFELCSNLSKGANRSVAGLKMCAIVCANQDVGGGNVSRIGRISFDLAEKR